MDTQSNTLNIEKNRKRDNIDPQAKFALPGTDFIDLYCQPLK